MVKKWVSKLLKKAIDENGGFWPIKEDLYAGYINRSWQIKDILPNELLLPHYSLPTRLESSRKKITSAFVGDPDNGFYFKRYNYRNFWYSLRRTLKTPESFKSLAFSIYMKEQGFSSPEVLAAVIFYRVGFLPGQSFLLTKQLSPNEKRFSTIAGELGSLDKFRPYANALVKLIIQLQDLKIGNNDLSLRHVYCRLDDAGNPIDSGICNFDQTYRNRFFKISTKARTRELAHLISSFLHCINSRHNKAYLNDVIKDFCQLYNENSKVKIDESKLFTATGKIISKSRSRKGGKRK